MGQAVCEVLWIQKLLAELSLLEKGKVVLILWIKAIINMTHNYVKHIEIDWDFIKKITNDGILILCY